MLCGVLEPTNGIIRINGLDMSDLDLKIYRQSIALVGEENEIFDGTFEDNVRMGRTEIEQKDLDWAAELTLLTPIIDRLHNGWNHRLLSQGRNLSLGQRQRVMIARAIVSRPRLLILDETFTGIGENNKLKILSALLSPSRSWTILDVSHDAEVVSRSQKVIVLGEGKVIEVGSPRELTQKKNSAFSTLFPELSRQFKSEAA
jgi:ATP-binding cassette subfamily B protein